MNQKKQDTLNVQQQMNQKKQNTLNIQQQMNKKKQNTSAIITGKNCFLLNPVQEFIEIEA